MKILKYIVFLSILTSIFFLIYRQSDQNTDSETDDESECSIDEVKIAVANDGTFINAEKSQVRDKGLHIPDFLDAETLDGKFYDRRRYKVSSRIFGLQ